MNEGNKTRPMLEDNKKVLRSCNIFFEQLQINPPKFQGFNGILNYVLCFSAAVLYQLSYEDPIYRQHCEFFLKTLNNWQVGGGIKKRNQSKTFFCWPPLFEKWRNQIKYSGTSI